MTFIQEIEAFKQKQHQIERQVIIAEVMSLHRKFITGEKHERQNDKAVQSRAICQLQAG